ncbi:hypothetical protein EI94DRAFT_1896839 [Lactarius quietus]|nr:hypothetical protein EI94DRAFT_1896839 [Lactarius quietus]
MTSKTSTLWLDNDQMQNMIKLIQDAKMLDKCIIQQELRYLAELEEAWMDKHILEPVWKSLMTKMLTDWSDLILWSTVMLSVNVGFLAIPGVISPNNNAPTAAIPNQIASYLSLISSVGSIVVGLLLVRYHRTKKEEDTDGAPSLGTLNVGQHKPSTSASYWNYVNFCGCTHHMVHVELLEG